MNSSREDKLQLNIYARVSDANVIFGGAQSRAKIEKEYKKDSETDAARNVYIVIRESKYNGYLAVDYGYLKQPGAEFKTGSIRVIAGLSQTELIDLLFQDHILRDRHTVTIRVLRPVDGEQLFRLPTINSIDADEVKSIIPPRRQTPVSLTRVPALFANSGTLSLNAPIENTEAFNCPISLTIMRNPVLTADQRNYEEALIRTYISNQGGIALSPVDRVTPIRETLPNMELRNRIHEAVLRSSNLAAQFLEAHRDAILNPQLVLGEIDFAAKFRRAYPELLLTEGQRFVAGA